MKKFAVFIEMIKVNIQGRMEYRAEFLSMFAAQFLAYSFEFLMIWIMISKFKTIGAWRPFEVMFIYSINLFSYALAGTFFYSTHYRLPGMIQNGDFDEVLLRPLNPFSYLMARNFNFGYISHIILSTVTMVICFVKLEISLTIVGCLFLIITLLAGTLIQSAMFIYVTVPSFWMIRSNSLRGFLGLFRYYVQYPLSIYNKTTQVLLTLIVPYGFISFYPAQFFLKKNDFMIFHPIFQFLSPVVGLIMFIGSYKLWSTGIKNYTSTGS
jgi:ABC-2 type transport system permease protein